MVPLGHPNLEDRVAELTPPKPERLDYKPTTPGIRTYIIDTPVRADEADKSNNAKSKEVAVTEAKMIFAVSPE